MVPAPAGDLGRPGGRRAVHRNGRERGDLFLRITKLTGPSREIRATRGGRIILRRQMETIYTAELLEANETWRHGLSEDELLEAFNLITQEWTTSDS